MTGMRLDVLIDARARLGEGPAWDESRGRLLWVDIEGRLLHLTDPATGADETIAFEETIGFAVPAGGSLVVAGLGTAVAVVDLDTRRHAELAAPETAISGNRFNDGKCDPAGRLWAGTMALDEHEGAGSLYSLDGELRVTRHVSPVTVSNGLAWTGDARTMYYVDSPTRQVAAYDYDMATGTIAGRRVAYEVPDGEGFPDGMTIDADGCLWIALWDGRRVIRVDPVAGGIVREISVPVSRPTSCCFGGPALDELFITSARTRLDPGQLEREPLAGAVFRCRPGVRGLPTVPFAGGERLRALLSAPR